MSRDALKPQSKAVLAFLAFGPLVLWAAVYFPYSRAQRSADRFELDVQHSNFNSPVPVADFNGDGKKETLRKTSDHGIVVEDGPRELLRLPYHHTDGSFRTRIALIAEDGSPPRLLQYDDAEGEGARQVFAWNGSSLAPAAPGRLDKEVLHGLGIGEDRFALRDFSIFALTAGLLPYYLVLALWGWKKFRA